MATENAKSNGTPPPVRPWFKQKTTWNGLALFLLGLVQLASGNWELGSAVMVFGFAVITGREATAKVEAMLKQLAPLILVTLVFLMPACTAAQKQKAGEVLTTTGGAVGAIAEVLAPVPWAKYATIGALAMQAAGNVLADRSQKKEQQTPDES